MVNRSGARSNSQLYTSQSARQRRKSNWIYGPEPSKLTKAAVLRLPILVEQELFFWSRRHGFRYSQCVVGDGQVPTFHCRFVEAHGSTLSVKAEANESVLVDAEGPLISYPSQYSHVDIHRTRGTYVRLSELLRKGKKRINQ